MTFWLIFLNCVTVYPIKIHVKHSLTQIDPHIIWEGNQQTLASLQENIVFFFYQKSNRDKILQKIHLRKLEKKESIKKSFSGPFTNCKKENDKLLEQFLFFYTHQNQSWISSLQNYALLLLQKCKYQYVQKNAKNILYWISVYEEYH